MTDYSTATKESIKLAQDSKNKSYKKVSPPFGYFGSKNKLAFKLCKQLPPHNCWIEAFCGSASLTLAKPPAPIEVINDVDNEIINVFKQLRENHTELCRMLQLTPYARYEFENAKVINENDSDLEKARKFLIKAMMAINGIMGKDSGGFSYSLSYSRNSRGARVNRWYNLTSRLLKVIERIRSIRIENRDAKKIFKKFLDRPATLVYLDPPYLGERARGYNEDLNDEQYHEELLNLANEAQCMVFISGYENELYNDILNINRGWKRKTIPATTKGSNGKSYKRSEVVWMNSHYINALEKKGVPIKLTDKEKRNNKVNPKR